MIYNHMMSALHDRFWRALVGLTFLFATVVTTFASAHGPAATMAPCATEQSLSGPKSDCNDQTAKALTCSLALCAAVAIVTASPILRDANVTRAISFPPARATHIVDATLPPDPFPPRTLNSV